MVLAYVTDIRWVSIVMHEHNAPNITTAKVDAMITWGDRVLHTQSYASWAVGVDDESARRRNLALNITDTDVNDENERDDEGCQ